MSWISGVGMGTGPSQSAEAHSAASEEGVTHLNPLMRRKRPRNKMMTNKTDSAALFTEQAAILCREAFPSKVGVETAMLPCKPAFRHPFPSVTRKGEASWNIREQRAEWQGNTVLLRTCRRRGNAGPPIETLRLKWFFKNVVHVKNYFVS